MSIKYAQWIHFNKCRVFYLDTLVFILFFKNGINYWKDEIDKIKLLWDFHSIVPEKLVVTMKFWILLFWLRTTWLLDLNITISNTCISITIQVVSFFQILISVEKYPITIGVTIYLLWNSSANDNWINSVPRVHGIHNAKKWVGFLSFLICVYFWFSFLLGVISDFF